MKLIVQEHLTLDGVVQGPGVPDEDRSGGFDQGGWLVPYADDVFGQMMVDSISGADGLLLGRTTYEIFAGYWPRVTDADNQVAAMLNRMPKYVASKTLGTVEWNNSTLIKGDVAEGVAGLKREPGRELQVHGSADLVQTLMRDDLVDEYRLYFAPIVLGTGKRLFREGAVPAAMRLTDTKRTTTGLVAHTYERAGKPEYGSFAIEE
ncbi:MAG TPA: dihydrofolate reductase family protein [Acidimicrobiia bacterium]|nr:dihydrofolate reductase family protein [Acidimicrobiia bacterium]